MSGQEFTDIQQALLFCFGQFIGWWFVALVVITVFLSVLIAWLIFLQAISPNE